MPCDYLEYHRSGNRLHGRTRDPRRLSASFPGKVLAVLKHRFQTFNGTLESGMDLVCCELIERNGDTLKEIVCRKAREQGEPQAFLNWIENANRFYNTLVDRIVPGYPKAQAAALEDQLGCHDAYLVKGEIDHKDSLGNSGRIQDGCCQWMSRRAGTPAVKANAPARCPRCLGSSSGSTCRATKRWFIPNTATSPRRHPRH